MLCPRPCTHPLIPIPNRTRTRIRIRNTIRTAPKRNHPRPSPRAINARTPPLRRSFRRDQRRPSAPIRYVVRERRP